MKFGQASLHDGSVQHLEALPQVIRDVFKTAQEIDQRWLIDLAADRQNLLIKGQSLNLFFPADVSIAYLHIPVTSSHGGWFRRVFTTVEATSSIKADKLGEKLETSS